MQQFTNNKLLFFMSSSPGYRQTDTGVSSLSPVFIFPFSFYRLECITWMCYFLSGAALWAVSIVCVSIPSQVFIPTSSFLCIIAFLLIQLIWLYQDILCYPYSLCVHSPHSIPGWIIYIQVNRLASLRILWKFCLPGAHQSYSQNLHHCSDITFSFQISGLFLFYVGFFVCLAV